MRNSRRRKKTTHRQESEVTELEVAPCTCGNRIRDLEGRILEQASELDNILEAYSSLINEVDYLKRLNRWLSETQTSRAAPVPTVDLPTPASLSEAVRLADQHFGDRLVIHPLALQGLNELDSSLNARPWAQMTLLAFKALHAYALALHDGDSCGSFWTWCETSKSPHAWLATQKKLAMGESRQLMSNRRLSAFRQLPISTDVASAGRIEMTYHIKIAEGGALAPRIYFYIDSTAAVIHVGFVGPHKLMPNTQIGGKK